jgi:hypothetical protein
MDKEQLRIRAERRRKFIQADAQDSLVAEIGRYWLSKAHLWDPASTERVPSSVPVGPEFERFVKDFMKHNGYRTLEFGDGAVKAGAEAVAAWIDYNGQREVGRDYPNPLTEVDKDKGAGGYVAASLQKRADHIYGPINEDRYRSMYGMPEEWARTCPEHAGVQMRRVSDGIYQCPMSGDTYSYTDGHEVEYHVGVHNQTNPNWNDTWPQPTFLSSPNQQSTRASGGTWEKVEAIPDLTNSVDADSEHLRVLPIYDGAEDDTAFIQNTEDLYKNSNTKRFTKRAESIEVGIADNLFGKTTLHSRYCPDHKGVSLYRLADNVFQCPLDRAVYDYSKGFKTQDGTEHNGGSVADMTPDWPEFYQSPHPFISVQKANKIKRLTKTSASLPEVGKEQDRRKQQEKQISGLRDYRNVAEQWISPGYDLEQAKAEFSDILEKVLDAKSLQTALVGVRKAQNTMNLLEHFWYLLAKHEGEGVLRTSLNLNKKAFTNLEYRLARDLDRALRGDEEAAKVLGLISDGVFSKGKSFMEAAQAAYDYVEMGNKESPPLEVSEEEAGYVFDSPDDNYGAW